jgi:hypothetical protein
MTRSYTRTITHTYVLLDLSEAAYLEIKNKLIANDYEHCIQDKDENEERIDMHGIAIVKEKPIIAKFTLEEIDIKIKPKKEEIQVDYTFNEEFRSE